MIWRVLSIVIFICAVVVVVVPLWTPIGANGVSAPRSASLYEVAPGHSLDLAIPAEVASVRIASMAIVSENTEDVVYELQVSWLLDDGREVSSRVFSERARLSWFPPLPTTPKQRLLVSGVARVAADAQVTAVPVKPFLPSGGVLRITTRTGGPTLLIEASADDAVDLVTISRSLLAPRLDQVLTARQKTGIASWALLTDDDRRASIASNNRPIDAHHGRTSPASIWLEGVRPDADERGARELRLLPGHRVALNVIGPTTVRLSGLGPSEHLEARIVADGAGAAVTEEGRTRSSNSIGLRDEGEPRAIEVPMEGPASVVLGNTGTEIASFVASMDKTDPTLLFGFTAAAVLDETAPQEDTILIGPELRIQRSYRLFRDAPHPIIVNTWGFDRDDVVTLWVRPVLESLTDERPRRIRIVGRADDDRVVFTSEAEAPSFPSAFERATDLSHIDAHRDRSSLADRVLGDPVTISVRLQPEVSRLNVESDEDLLVIIGLAGPLGGDERLYQLPWGNVDVRYRWKRLGPWHAVPADNEEALRQAGQVADVAANVRLEGRGGAEKPGTSPARRYTTLEPVSASALATGRIWLIPATLPALPDLGVYCRLPVTSGASRFLFSPEAVDGSLQGIVVANRSAFGQTYGVEIDGAPWRRGVIRQRVTRLSSMREPAHRTARLSAPEGSSLLLRTVAGNGACSSMLRAARAFPLKTGGRIDFAVDKELREQLLLIGSLGTAAGIVTVEVNAVDSDYEQVSTSTTRVTRAENSIPTDIVAQALDDPDVVRKQRSSIAALLASDLKAGRYIVTVENHGPPISVFAATETHSKDPSERTGARFFYSQEEDTP